MSYHRPLHHRLGRLRAPRTHLIFAFVASTSLGCFSSLTRTTTIEYEPLEPTFHTQRSENAQYDTTLDAEEQQYLRASISTYSTCKTVQTPHYREIEVTRFEGKRVAPALAYASLGLSAGLALGIVPLTLEDAIVDNAKVEPMVRLTMLTSGLALLATGGVALIRASVHAASEHEERTEGIVHDGVPPNDDTTPAPPRTLKCNSEAVAGAPIALFVEDVNGRSWEIPLGRTNARGVLRSDALAALSAQFPGWPSTLPELRSLALVASTKPKVQLGPVQLSELTSLQLSENGRYAKSLQQVRNAPSATPTAPAAPTTLSADNVLSAAKEAVLLCAWPTADLTSLKLLSPAVETKLSTQSIQITLTARLDAKATGAAAALRELFGLGLDIYANLEFVVSLSASRDRVLSAALKWGSYDAVLAPGTTVKAIQEVIFGEGNLPLKLVCPPPPP